MPDRSRHVHNLPSLFWEANELRHHYYIHQERRGYLEQLEELGNEEYLKMRLLFYTDPWKVLMALAAEELSRNTKDDQPEP